MKRLLSIALALVMVLSAGFVPRTAWADGSDYDYSIESDSEYWNNVDPGQSISLAIRVLPSAEGCSFEWKYTPPYGEETVIDGQTGPVLNISDPMAGYYRVTVTLPGGSTLYEAFEVDVNNYFSLYCDTGTDDWTSNSMELEVKTGESVTLNTYIGEGDDPGVLSYKWTRMIYDSDGYGHQDLIPGAEDSSYTISSFDAFREDYTCIAIDRFGHTEEAYYRVYKDTGFTVQSATGSSSGDNTGPWSTIRVPVAPEDTTVLKVNASVEEEYMPLTYSWYTNDENWTTVKIEGADGPELTTFPAEIDGQSYHCDVSFSYDQNTSRTKSVYYSLDIDNSLSVKAKNGQTSYRVHPGEAFDLEVEASVKKGSISYKWFNGVTGEEIEGANAAVLHADGITAYTEYECMVSDDYGNNNWIYFYVNIDNELTIKAVTEQVIKVSPGESASFEVLGTAYSGEIRYQWFSRSSGTGSETAIEGATSPKFTTPALSATQIYSCRVTDDYGNTRTMQFTAKIDAGLTVRTEGASNIALLPGESAEFRMSASVAPGAGSVHFQWQKELNAPPYGYQNIEGATSASYTAEAAGSYTYYRCVVTDDYGNTETRFFTVYIDDERIAAPEYYNVYADYGTDAVINAVSRIDDPENISYKWYKGNGELLDATGPSLTVSNVTGRDSYYFIATYKGYSFRQYATVIVDSGFDPVAPLSGSVTGSIGDKVTLEVDPGAYKGEVSYVWEKNGETISGENGNAIEVTVDNTVCNYTVTASDEYGNTYHFYYNVGTGRLQLEAQTDNNVFVSPGQTASFAVKPVQGENVQYRWYDNYGNAVAGANGPSMTTGPIERYSRYRCEVNADGQYSMMWFNAIIDTHLYADAKDSVYNFTVKKGDSIDLEVVASADTELTYHWYDMYEGSDYSDVNGPKLTLENVQSFRNVECDIYDEYGYWYWVTFKISIDNGLKLGSIPDVYVKAGERAEIAVDASCDQGELNYTLIDVESRGSMPYVSLSDGKLITTRINNDHKMELNIRDNLGNRASKAFTIHVLPEGGLMKGDVNGDNEISADDLTLLSRFVAGIEPIPSDAVKAACDVTGEGEVTADDLTKLSRKVAGIIQTLD